MHAGPFFQEHLRLNILNFMLVCRFTQVVEISLLTEFTVGNASGKGILQLLFVQV